MDNKNINPFVILDVSPRATDEEIKKSFHKLLKLWHPDLHIEDRENATEQTKLITTAYKMLAPMTESDRIYLYRRLTAKTAQQRRQSVTTKTSTATTTSAEEQNEQLADPTNRRQLYKQWCDERKKRKQERLKKVNTSTSDLTEQTQTNNTTVQQKTQNTFDRHTQDFTAEYADNKPQQQGGTYNAEVASTVATSHAQNVTINNNQPDNNDTITSYNKAVDTATQKSDDIKPQHTQQQETVNTADAKQQVTTDTTTDNTQPNKPKHLRMPRPPRYHTPQVTLNDSYQKVQMYDVDNRKITKIGYDVMSTTMFVEWKHKKVMAYMEVPTIIFVQLQHAKDALKYWKDNVKGKYTELEV